MDACIVTSGTGNAFPKDTGNSQTSPAGDGHWPPCGVKGAGTTLQAKHHLGRV